MHNLSDNDLDKLGRDAAEHYSVPQGSSSWPVLARRLDEEMPQKKDRRRFFWIFLSAVLMIGAGSYFYFVRPESKNETRTEKVIDTKASVPGSVTNETDPAASSESALNDQKRSTSPDKKDDADASNAAGSVQEKFGITRVKTGKKGLYNGNPRNNKLASLSSEDKAVLVETKQDQENQHVDSYTERAVDPPPGDLQPEDKKISEQNNPTTKPETSTSIIAQSEEKQEGKGSIKPENKKKKPRPFEIGVVYAPDLSNVEFTHSAEAGYNLGFTVGYNISNRWSVNTGVLWTKKNYTTSGDNYKFPPGYWTSNPNVKLNAVKASCEMIDIPINVRYNWLVGKHFSAFASTGISSYLMKEEDFHYYFTYSNVPAYRHWTNKKSKDYWFSIGNFSLGYEQHIGQAFSVQAEPFIKFSLSEVGSGSVKLNSLGMFIGVKYKPAFKK